MVGPCHIPVWSNYKLAAESAFGFILKGEAVCPIKESVGSSPAGDHSPWSLAHELIHQNDDISCCFDYVGCTFVCNFQEKEYHQWFFTTSRRTLSTSSYTNSHASPPILQLQSTPLCFSWPCTFPILPKLWEVAVPVSQEAVREGALDRVQHTWLSWLLIFDGITVSRWLFSAERADIRIQDQSQTTFSKIFNCVPHSRVLLPLLGQTCSLSDIHLASDLTEVCLVQLSQARHTSPRKHHLSDALLFK